VVRRQLSVDRTMSCVPFGREGGSDEGKHSEWYGRAEDVKSFPDIEYWQAQDDITKFDAVREMVMEAYLAKGVDLRGSRLQKTVESYKRREVANNESPA
jgi:hypothetical protein